MSRVTPTQIALSKRVFAHEYGRAESADESHGAPGRVLVTLLEALVPVLGAAGTDALFFRSVKLARNQFSELATLPPLPSLTAHSADASVAASLNECLRELAPAAAAEAAECLLAALLALLSSFIGEPLVWQIVQKAFPGIHSNQSKESE